MRRKRWSTVVRCLCIICYFFFFFFYIFPFWFNPFWTQITNNGGLKGDLGMQRYLFKQLDCVVGKVQVRSCKHHSHHVPGQHVIARSNAPLLVILKPLMVIYQWPGPMLTPIVIDSQGQCAHPCNVVKTNDSLYLTFIFNIIGTPRFTESIHNVRLSPIHGVIFLLIVFM